MSKINKLEEKIYELEEKIEDLENKVYKLERYLIAKNRNEIAWFELKNPTYPYFDVYLTWIDDSNLSVYEVFVGQRLIFDVDFVEEIYHNKETDDLYVKFWTKYYKLDKKEKKLNEIYFDKKTILGEKVMVK